jgi:site-specific DNA recombinase
MKAILLVRISSVSQKLDEQTSNLINHAQSKGYTEDNLIIIEDVESGINLAEEERNGLNKMKAEISADKKVNAVFVWELSRLTRKPTTAYSLRDYFNENRIQLYCYSPSFQLLRSDLVDLDDNGSLLFALYIQMAEAEMRNKKARFHRSKIRNARTGKYSGGIIKFGYKVNSKGYYEIKEDEAEIVRCVFDRYEQGISIFKLNKELRERGKIHSDSFVGECLKTEAYTGVSGNQQCWFFRN